jgi:hypothetical protein
MPSNFNWQAEDDRYWDEYRDPEGPKIPKRPKFRIGFRFVLIGLLLVVVVGAGVAIYRQVNRFVSETESTVESDILNSQDLVLHAVDVSDPEVLVSVLSGRDDDWTSAMVSLLDQNLFFDRAPYGLEWDRSAEPADLEITLAPDHRSAELQFSLAYSQPRVSGLSRGTTDRIRLLQTAVFRVSSDRWLLSPPLEDFWGDDIRAEGGHIAVRFPSRDAEIGRRLAADLEAAVVSACSSLAALDCLEGSRMNIVLSTNPAVIATAAEPFSKFSNQRELILPAPTLMGTPTDEDGYQAVKNVFAALTIQRLLNLSNDWECCDSAVFYQALQDSQLAALEIKEWPGLPQLYTDVLRKKVSLADLSEQWEMPYVDEDNSNAEDDWLVYSFIEFLLNERIAVPAVQMQNALTSSRNFSQWLRQIAQVDYSSEYLEQSWNEYLLQRIDSWQVSPLISLPEQDIAMICEEGIVGSSTMYVLDTETESWTQAMNNREFVYMSPILYGGGILLSEQLFRPERVQTMLWRDSQEYVIDEGHRVIRLTGGINPDHSVVGLSGYDTLTRTGGNYILDLANCGARGCPYESVPGDLRWSPNGEKTIFIDASDDQAIMVGDETGSDAERAALGRGPFWISDDTFGYTTVIGEPVIVTQTLGIQGATDFYTNVTASEVITGADRSDIFLAGAAMLLEDPPRLIVVAVNRNDGSAYLLSYEWETDSSKLIYQVGGNGEQLLNGSISPDGRWLAFSTLERVGEAQSLENRVLLYDYETGAIQELLPDDGTSVSPYDWSADSKWLLQLDDRKLILTAPEVNYQYLIMHGLNSCRGAAWTNVQ